MNEAIANNDLQAALIELIQLDYDAIAAYDTAIAHIISKPYQSKLIEFRQDHEKHIAEIGQLLKVREIAVPQGPDLKSYLSKVSILFGDLFSDKAILVALLNSEMNLHTAYDKANQCEDIWLDFIEILAKALSDEVRHKEWLEEQMIAL